MQTLTPPAKGWRHRRRTGHATQDGLAGAAVEPWHDDLLAAIAVLSKSTRLRPRVIVTERAEIDRLMSETLSALRRLFASIGSYLEQVLQPLKPHIGCDTVHTFILETRRELDELAACRIADEAYVEDLTITKSGDKSVSLEVEGSLGAAG